MLCSNWILWSSILTEYSELRYGKYSNKLSDETGVLFKFNNDSKIAKATSHFLKLLIGFNKLHMQ